MQSADDEKTKSAPKRHRRINLAFLLPVVLLIITVVLVSIWHNHTGRLVLANHTYHLQIAQTDSAKRKGLGDRGSMPIDQGMLFVYKEPQNLCFWMKDMHFPLDIIWLGPDKRVVSIVRNLPANSYPRTYCSYAQYVIELNAGQAQYNKLAYNQKLSF